LKCGDKILRFKGLYLPAAKSFAEKLHQFLLILFLDFNQTEMVLQHNSIPSPRITMDNQQYQQWLPTLSGLGFIAEEEPPSGPGDQK